MKTEMIHTRIDPNIKHKAEKIFSTLGINTADAIRMFLNQVTLNHGLPFDVKIPNKETRRAMQDVELGKNLHKLSSVEELDRLCDA